MRVLGMKHRPAVFCLGENRNILNVVLRVCYGLRRFFPLCVQSISAYLSHLFRNSLNGTKHYLFKMII